MLRDAQHVIDYATRTDGLNYPVENIILIGSSLGSGVAVQMAAKYPSLKALVAIAPFTSVRDVALHIAGSISKLVIPDIFRSCDIMPELQLPTLFIHGIKDEMIPYSHSVKLYERCASSQKRLELRESMDHTRYQLDKDIFTPLQKFLTDSVQITDLPILRMEPLDFESVFPEEKISKLRSFTSAEISKLNAESVIITSGRESLPVESFKSTQFKEDTEDRKDSDDGKEPIQEMLSVLKGGDSDTPPMSKTLLT